MGLTPPRWLDPAAAVEWEKVAPLLDQLGIEIDRQALAAYCQTWATFVVSASHASTCEPARRVILDCLKAMADYWLRIILVIRKHERP